MPSLLFFFGTASSVIVTFPATLVLLLEMVLRLIRSLHLNASEASLPPLSVIEVNDKEDLVLLM